MFSVFEEARQNEKYIEWLAHVWRR